MTTHPIHIIGGGLAGCEAAWQLLQRGHSVVLHEMRPHTMTPAHRSSGLAELVCSNSLRSDDAEASAIGLLHAEMRRMDSLILAAADQTRLPAGGALAVDRDGFSAHITQTLRQHPALTVVEEEMTELPPEQWGVSLLATGPLTSLPLAEALAAVTGEESLSFFDAIAPVVYKESIDFNIAWFQSRYDKGDGADYINCPLSQEQYQAFIQALLEAEAIGFHEWEKGIPFFEGCLPIEVMAKRGPQTLTFGPMKPVGLTNPYGPKPYAVVQLRQDNALGTLYNMVGFQTKLRHGEQTRLFRTIPGLEHAEFARLGGMHRNTFVNGPQVLTPRLALKNRPYLHLAGQVTGCEGYVESAALGLLAGLFIACPDCPPPPATTALGALLNHVTVGADAASYQPMNINFGLFPPPPERDSNGRRIKGRDRKVFLSQRASHDIEDWKAACP